MRKNVLLMTGLWLALSAQAQQEKPSLYFTAEEMPDMMVFMPGPPDSTAVGFTNDVSRYFWGKQMRHDAVRAAEATRDAVYSMETILTEFEEAFGMKISKERTPEMYKLLEEATATCDKVSTLPKQKYMRRRPFMVFNEETLYPKDEPALRKNGSYPSGHTILGWSAALLMSEINPDRATEILARGYRYGENRVVVGAHWQSDTDAGRVAASAAYARLHTSDRFLQQMAKAREEYKKVVASGQAEHSVYGFSAKDGDGQTVSLCQWKGDVLLIVNTATRCGFTPQYKELEELYEKYRDQGFTILDFPCNQFGQQAPGSFQEIHQFCTANFNIEFPQFDKIDVNGEHALPLYSWLKSQQGPDIKWNFTKFLVSRDGRVLKRFEPRATTQDMLADIEAALKNGR